MKFYYIANVGLPTTKAHGAHIMNMCSAFLKSGMQIELIIPKHSGGSIDDIFKFYGIKEKIKISEIFALNLSKFGLRGKWVVILRALFFSLSVFLYIIFHPTKFKQDSIFYFRGEFAPLFSVILKKNIFWELHKFDKKLKRYYQRILRKIRGLILITKKAREDFIKLGVKAEKILVAPDAVDLGKFDLDISIKEARKKLNLSQDKKLIGYTGKFTTMGMDKGIKDILHALKILNDKNILFMAIGGSESDIKFYQKIAKDLAVSDQVIFCGHFSQDKLAIFQKVFDILLMPFPYTEHYAYYMSPLKMFEYMASGRPIVATDLPSIREVLNENNAILVKPDNPQNLAKGIMVALDNKELGKKISARAFLDVQEYTWKKRAERIIRFIK